MTSVTGERKKDAEASRSSIPFVWRSGWDSNPREIAPKLISSQPRYDHFDTAACIVECIMPQVRGGGKLFAGIYLQGAA